MRSSYNFPYTQTSSKSVLHVPITTELLELLFTLLDEESIAEDEESSVFLLDEEPIAEDCTLLLLLLDEFISLFLHDDIRITSPEECESFLTDELVSSKVSIEVPLEHSSLHDVKKNMIIIEASSICVVAFRQPC